MNTPRAGTFTLEKVKAKLLPWSCCLTLLNVFGLHYSLWQSSCEMYKSSWVFLICVYRTHMELIRAYIYMLYLTLILIWVTYLMFSGRGHPVSFLFSISKYLNFSVSIKAALRFSIWLGSIDHSFSLVKWITKYSSSFLSICLTDIAVCFSFGISMIFPFSFCLPFIIYSYVKTVNNNDFF